MKNVSLLLVLSCVFLIVQGSGLERPAPVLEKKTTAYRHLMKAAGVVVAAAGAQRLGQVVRTNCGPALTNSLGVVGVGFIAAEAVPHLKQANQFTKSLPTPFANNPIVPNTLATLGIAYAGRKGVEWALGLADGQALPFWTNAAIATGTILAVGKVVEIVMVPKPVERIN